jgi:hypothetical protein
MDFLEGIIVVGVVLRKKEPLEEIWYRKMAGWEFTCR